MITQKAEVEQYNDLDGNLVVDENGDPVDPDAARIIDLIAVATFTDANTATYSATLFADCSGADCDAIAYDWNIAEIPCTSEYLGTFFTPRLVLKDQLLEIQSFLECRCVSFFTLICGYLSF